MKRKAMKMGRKQISELVTVVSGSVSEHVEVYIYTSPLSQIKRKTSSHTAHRVLILNFNVL